MMAVPMDETPSAPSGRELAQLLFQKNAELEDGLRKSAQSKVPSDPNAWLQIRENYEAIILEDHEFSENHEIEFRVWQLHYRRIEEFRLHINAASAAVPTGIQGGKVIARPDRIKKIRSVFKSFLSEATGFYHDLILKVRSKYGLPLGYFSEGSENQILLSKDEKELMELKKGLLSCHRSLIYLGDLARYKGLYGDGDSVSQDYAAAFSYYTQAASLWPSSGNPHHQLAILASYSGNEFVALYRYFRSLAVDNPFTTARDNLIIAFEKNRQSFLLLPCKAKVTSIETLPTRSIGRGRGRGYNKILSKETKTESSPIKERELSALDILKAFSTRFVRLNGILFTRTSLETFEDVFSSVISDMDELLSSGPEEELNFGVDGAENGLFVVRLMAILIYTVHNVKWNSEGQSYAEVLQRKTLLQKAFTAAFEFAGHILKRCIQLCDATSSYLLPAILVFIEWLACHLDFAAGFDVEEKQVVSRSYFWNQFVILLNKLMLSGFVSLESDEDETCFSDMRQYDDQETGNRLALWEDFELRGFLPLVPAQVILDFSRKQPFGGDRNSKEKKARAQRILAAGRALMNVVQVDQKGMYFDANIKKFVIAAEPPEPKDSRCAAYSSAPELNVAKQVPQAENAFDPAEVQSKAKLYVEQEEEEEEIVFKPTVVYPSTSTANLSAYEAIHHVKSYGGGDHSSYNEIITAPVGSVQMSTSLNASYMNAPKITEQASLQGPSAPNWSINHESFLWDRLRGLNISDRGWSPLQGLQNGSCGSHSNVLPSAFLSSTNHNTSNMPQSQMNVPEAVIPSKLDSVVPSGATCNGVPAMLSATLPTTVLRKNPVSRPVRHFGPPPGFSHIPPKQLEDSIANPIARGPTVSNGDYGCLDGSQLSATKNIGIDDSINQISHMFPTSTSTIGASSGAIDFPFPGKQVPDMQAQVTNEKWQDFQLFYQVRQSSEKQVASLSGQHQRRSLWSGR